MRCSPRRQSEHGVVPGRYFSDLLKLVSIFGLRWEGATVGDLHETYLGTAVRPCIEADPSPLMTQRPHFPPPQQSSVIIAMLVHNPAAWLLSTPPEV